MLRMAPDDSFTTIGNPDGDSPPTYNDMPSVPTFSGATWLNDALQDISEHPEEWKAVKGAEDKFLCLKDLKVGRRFASGSSGRVYLGTYKDQEVAVKILRPPASDKDRDKLEAEFLQEVSTLNSVDHPNIVKVSAP